MTSRDQFISDIEAFLQKTGMKPSKFGLDALNDPSFLPRLRKGRDVGLSVVERVRAFIKEKEPA